MASYDIGSALPHHFTWAIREADVLKAEVLRPVAAEVTDELEAMGLASSTDSVLTRRGMETRFWLMFGMEHAPHEVSRLLLAGAGSCASARFAGTVGALNGSRGAISAPAS